MRYIIQIKVIHFFFVYTVRCAAKSGQNSSAIILFSTITIALVIILFCYISILRRIHNFMMTSVLEQHAEIERKATKKILSYMAMFMLQWIPMSISQGARIVKVKKYSIN